MKKLSLLLLILSSVACHQNVDEHVNKLEDPFIHTAYFWLKDGLTAKEIAAFIDDCEKLAQIETVRSFYSGKPANTNRAVIENTYDYSVVFHFENLEDQEYYQQHPIHLELIEKHSAKWEKVMVTDIEHGSPSE